MSEDRKTLTPAEFVERYSDCVAASCVDGVYSIDCDRPNPRRSTEQEMARWSNDSDVRIEVIETGLVGWPGEHFVRVDCGDRRYHLMATLRGES